MTPRRRATCRTPFGTTRTITAIALDSFRTFTSLRCHNSQIWLPLTIPNGPPWVYFFENGNEDLNNLTLDYSLCSPVPEGAPPNCATANVTVLFMVIGTRPKLPSYQEFLFFFFCEEATCEGLLRTRRSFRLWGLVSVHSHPFPGSWGKKTSRQPLPTSNKTSFRARKGNSFAFLSFTTNLSWPRDKDQKIVNRSC